MVGYYDYVLGVIPVVMATPILAAAVLGLSVQAGVIAGGAGTLPLIGHAMFVRGPDGSDDATGVAGDAVDVTADDTTVAADGPAPAAD